MLAYDDFFHWLLAVRVVHHIRGRIRLRLIQMPEMPRLANKQWTGGNVQRVLEDVRGIRSLRVNPLALSCTVEYDPDLIPADAWAEFIAGRHTPAAAVLDGLLRQAYEEIAHAKP